MQLLTTGPNVRRVSDRSCGSLIWGFHRLMKSPKAPKPQPQKHADADQKHADADNAPGVQILLATMLSWY